METVQVLFNASLMVFIVATMLTAGLGTTLDQIRSVLSNPRLVVTVLAVGFLVRPLLGFGAAELFQLSVAGFVATALLWSCPGAPIGVQLTMTAKADVNSAAVFQVLLASIGSFTFAPTANAVISAGNLDADISIPVGDLIKTIVTLQLVPFVLGMLVRHWSPERASEWRAISSKFAGNLFWVVLALSILGSWQTVIDLIGQRVLLASILVTLIMIAIGRITARERTETNDAAGIIQACTNSGPAFAAIAIAFDGDAEIIGIMTALLLVQICIGMLAASFFARNRTHDDSSTPVSGL